jgi:hypothetical protein
MNEDRVQKKDEGNPESATESHAERSSAQVECPVVGIGASAGGLEAFTRLLKHLPTTTGMAYVFVQHLDPTHASLLLSLLARVTTMPVREIRDGMPVEPNQVYVLPLNATLALAQDTFTLGPLLAPSAERFAIDSFLRSLACCFREPLPMAHKVSRPSRPREASPSHKMPTPQPSHKCPRAPWPLVRSITCSHPKRSPGNSSGSVSSRKLKQRSFTLSILRASSPRMKSSRSPGCSGYSEPGRGSIFSPANQPPSNGGFSTVWPPCG